MSEVYNKYYRNNREYKLKYQKEYNERNKEKIKQYQKEYYSKHNENKKKYQKKHNEISKLEELLTYASTVNSFIVYF